MPELPEVETTRRGIEPHLVSRTIVSVDIRNHNFRWPIPSDLEATLPGLQVRAVNRRAKYLLVDCGAGNLIIHLGMSGSLRFLPGNTAQEPPQKHDHVELRFDCGGILRLRDPRRFGAVLWDAGPIEQNQLFVHLGPEPLTDAFSAQGLYERSRGLRAPIKAFVMDQRMVVGVGNIYANEALFHAGIRPQTAAGRIALGRYTKLVSATKEVLRLAINAGGSSLRDFVQTDGKPGYFQQQYWVYGRTGQACRACDATIRQIKQANRSTFYCPRCQR